MGVIGGIVTPSGERVDTDCLLRMSRAMIVRGKDMRGAYVNRGVGMFHHRSAWGERGSVPQPVTISRNGGACTVVLDGEVYGRGELGDLSVGVGVNSSAELALECYFAFGRSFADVLGGAYALAIFDEERGEVILARDGDGRKPLFYATDGERMAFSSEIKGLLRFQHGGVRVDIGRLRAYWLSPVGSLGGESLYRDIYVLPAGYCGVYSGMGMSLFPQERGLEGEEKESLRDVITPPAFCPDEAELSRLLTELLFAFDYPQFDCLAPSVLLVAEDAKKRKKRTVCFEDGTLCMSIEYARERVDRLCHLSGVELRSVTPKGNLISDREYKKMDRVLGKMIENLDQRLLCRLFGESYRSVLAEEKNIAKRIRMKGILWQSVLWVQSYPILLG